MYVINNYHIQRKKDYLKVINHDTARCPDCSTVMKCRSSYPRSVINADGTKDRYRLRLMYCAHCDALHAEIPDFMSEYKSYTKDAIKSAVQGILDGLTADDSTINRWKKHT